MGILKIFGLGEKNIIHQNNTTAGTVTAVKRCWWLKVNRKPVRTHATDGAVFPHIIEFTYEVNGTAYTGSRYLDWTVRAPAVGEHIRVYFDGGDPANYALNV